MGCFKKRCTIFVAIALLLAGCGGGGGSGSGDEPVGIGVSPPPPPAPPPPPSPPIQGPFSNTATQSIVSDNIVGSPQKIRNQNILIVRQPWRDPFESNIAEDRLIAYEHPAGSYRRIDHVVVDGLQNFLASQNSPVFYVVSDWRKLNVFHVDRGSSSISVSQDI